MNSQKQTLALERVFDAPPQVVFDYFTVPELVCTWWGPQSVTTEKVEIDLHSGGRCRWEMREADSSLLILNGEILDVDPPNRLVMTHQWQNDEQITTITFEFIALAGGKTLLKLKQDGIAAKIPIHLYDGWWTSSFTRLNSQHNMRTQP